MALLNVHLIPRTAYDTEISVFACIDYAFSEGALESLFPEEEPL